MPSDQFTWTSLYRELATKLTDYQDKQAELIALLEQIREKGFVVTPLKDKDESGNSFLLKEIDPFTFFGSFNRRVKEESRLGILAELKKHFHCEAELPADFSGIPILNNQRSWFIPYQYPKCTGFLSLSRLQCKCSKEPNHSQHIAPFGSTRRFRQ